jgi:hypothetical protein
MQMKRIRFPVVLGSNNETRTRVDGSFTDIPDGSTLYHVPHCEAFDSLILCHAARAVGAAHEFDVATSLLVAAAISSFLGLYAQKQYQLHPKRKCRIRPKNHPNRHDSTAE